MGQHPAKGLKIGRRSPDPLDPAADEKILVKHADGPEPGLRIGQDRLQDGVEPGAAFRELLEVRRFGGGLGPDEGGRRLGRHELAEQVGRRWWRRASHGTQGLGRRCGENDGPRILECRAGHRHQARTRVAGLGLGPADREGHRPPRQSRSQRDEMPALQVPERLRLPPLHPEQVGGARHVDVEEGAAHEEVGCLGRHILGELSEPLGRDDTCQSALASSAHKVGHRAQRELARLIRYLACDGGSEELRLIHHNEHRVPVVAPNLEQTAEEGSSMPHLRLGIEPFEVEHRRDAVHASAFPCQLQPVLGLRLGVDHEMAEPFSECDEIAFGVDHRLLHPGRALLQQAAQEVGLARAGIALHEQAGRQKPLVERNVR